MFARQSDCVCPPVVVVLGLVEGMLDCPCLQVLC